MRGKVVGCVAAVAGLVVTTLFPLPMPVALADPNAQTAAQAHGWGAPTRAEDFTGDLSGWDLYDGPGHDDNGRRTPSAVKVANGILTISGDARGNAEGMAWRSGAMYGRWEARMRASASDPDYHAVLLLWPDNEDEGGYGGEIDFMENSDPTRQSTEMFVHYGNEDQQAQRGRHRRRHAVAQLGRGVVARPHHRLPRRQGVVEHRQGRHPAAGPDAHDRPARPLPQPRRPQALDHAGRLGALLPDHGQRPVP